MYLFWTCADVISRESSQTSLSSKCSQISFKSLIGDLVAWGCRFHLENLLHEAITYIHLDWCTALLFFTGAWCVCSCHGTHVVARAACNPLGPSVSETYPPLLWIPEVKLYLMMLWVCLHEAYDLVPESLVTYDNHLIFRLVWQYLATPVCVCHCNPHPSVVALATPVCVCRC